MDDLTAARQALTGLCHELLREDAARGSMRHLVEEALKYVEPAPFYVVAFGEYGRGKSTLLSALAGRRSIFPHEPTDTTAIATTLAWGPTTQAVITAGNTDTGQSCQDVVPIGDVRLYVTEAARRESEQCVLVVEMRAPLDRLAPGLILVDTPGVNSRNEAHNLATQQYLSRAHVILFVASADEPLTTLELSVLRQAAQQCPQVVAVLTKADLGGAAELAGSASERVSRELARQVDVLPVSALMALDALDDRIPALEADSEIPKLAAQLAELQYIHGARTALFARQPLVRAITLLADPYLKKLSVLQHEVDEAESLDRARKEVESLNAAAERFHADLPREVGGVLSAIRAEIADRCSVLGQRIRAFRALPEQGVEPDAYFRGILNDLADIASAADDRRVQFMNQTVEAAKRLTEAELPQSPEATSLRSALRLSVTALSFGNRPGFSFSAIKEGAIAGVRLAPVTGTVGGIIGGTVASVPGAAAGATIGALVGHITGWVGGIRDAIRRARQDWQARNVQSMTDIALDCVDQSARSMAEKIHQSSLAIVSDLNAQFDAAVAERLNSLTMILQSAGSQTPDDVASRADLMAMTHQQIARYERMSHDLTDIAQRLERIASPGPPSGVVVAAAPPIAPQED